MVQKKHEVSLTLGDLAEVLRARLGLPKDESGVGSSIVLLLDGREVFIHDRTAVVCRAELREGIQNLDVRPVVAGSGDKV